ncbi:MAG: OmpA family protein [Cytophagales bacterium]|nr:OmpA family protein [Cytophagales bacterium]
MENLGYYKPYKGTQPYGGRKRPDIVSLVLGLLITLIISGFATSCVSTQKYNAAVEAKDTAETQLAQLKVDQTFQEYDHASELYEKQNDIYSKEQALFEKAKRMDSLRRILTLQKRALNDANRVVSALSDQEWQVDEINGLLKLDLDANLMFPLNSAELTGNGKALLSKLAHSIDSLNQEVNVRIVGHTDSQPFDHPSYDNWDLSADRSLAVVRALQQEGIDPTLISSVAKGPYDPMADNESEKGRMLNRRVEVQLVPVGVLDETISELLSNKS